MKKFKKIIAAVLACTMVFSAMAVATFAADVSTSINGGVDKVIVSGKAASAITSLSLKVDFPQITDATVVANINKAAAGTITDTNKILWNSWCSIGFIVTVNGTPSYYAFGGTKATWDFGFDLDGDKTIDTTKGDVKVLAANYLTLTDTAATIALPVNAKSGDTVTVKVVANGCWSQLAAVSGATVFTLATSADVTTGDNTTTTALIVAAVASLAVIATVSTKKFAVEK